MNRKYTVCLVIILLLMSSFNPLYADTSTKQDLVNVISQMDVPYNLEFYFSMGMDASRNLNVPLDMTDNAIFKNDNQAYNRIQVSNSFGMDMFGQTFASGAEDLERLEINGHTVTVNVYKRNNEKLAMSFVSWTSGAFNIILSMDDVEYIDRSTNIAMISSYVTMIDQALSRLNYEGVNVGFPGENPEDDRPKVTDEVVEPPEDEPLEVIEPEEEIEEDVEEVTYNFSLRRETNENTGQAFKGVTASEKSSIQLYLSVSQTSKSNGESSSESNPEITVKVQEAKFGVLEGIETGKKVRIQDTSVLTYTPPKYIDLKDKELIEVIKVEVYVGGNLKKTLTSEIKIMKTPVMLVHGFTGDASTWKKLDEELTPMGYDTVREYYVFNDKNGQSIPAQAKGLARHIREKISSLENEGIKVGQVDIVAHSMGGLISRYLIGHLPNLYNDNVRKLIMVGTPNNGCGLPDRVFGWGLSRIFDMHKEAGAQLYYKSDVIIALNKNVKYATHLDPNVEYGLLYGTGVGAGDGVVDTTSALLSGVESIPYIGRSHSPALTAVGFGPSLTEDDLVLDQVKKWLVTDIPRGEFRWIDIEISKIEGEAYIANPNYVQDDMYWKQIGENDTQALDILDDVKTGKGKVTLLLKASNEVFGTVEMHENTELYFEYASPHVMRVSLESGSARFTTKPKSGNHFEVSLNATGKIQTIMGYQTDYVVTASEEPQVFCLEGELETVFATSEANFNSAKLKTGQAIKLTNEGGFKQISVPENHWWDDSSELDKVPDVVVIPDLTDVPEIATGFIDDFVDAYLDDDMKDLFNSYREYIIGAGVMLVVVILFRIMRIGRRSKKK